MSTTVDLSLLGYAAIGVVLGAGYFAGLWWTLRGIAAASNPGVRLAASFALRAVIAGAVLLMLARVGPFAFAAAFAGFLLARLLLVRRWGRAS
jgi:F1F0 ATPase subunit 2